MLKNIKLFSTDSDRTTYESSASYETPYVSKVSADNSVHYNKVVQLITFTIASIQYQAIEGMTWGEWVSSEYNTDGFYWDSFQIASQDGQYCVCLSDYTSVKNSDEIIDGYQYLKGISSAGPE